MKIRFKLDQALGLFFLILGIYIIRRTSDFKAFVELNVPGPAVVPRATAVLMILFSLYVIIMSLLGRSPAPKPVFEAARKPSILTAIFGLAYVLLVPIVGFYVCSFLLPIMFHLFVSDTKNTGGKKPLLAAVVFSLCLTLVLFLLFEIVLNLILPGGFLI